jgi:hypothetical protein
VKGKLANGVGSQYSSHYLGTWCIRTIGWVIRTLEAQVGQFLLGCKCPVSRGIVLQGQDPLGDLPAAWRFSFKMPFICTSRDK